MLTKVLPVILIGLVIIAIIALLLFNSDAEDWTAEPTPVPTRCPGMEGCGSIPTALIRLQEAITKSNGMRAPPIAV